MRLALAAAALLALAACGEAGEGLTDAAGDFAKEAAKAAGVAADTKTVCVLAGQDETFCGCLQEKLGPELDPAKLDALREAVARTLGGDPTGEGADPATRDAVIACAAQATVQGAVGGEQEAEQ